MFLRLNSAFSILNGIFLIVAPGFAANLMFGEPADWIALVLRALGVGLTVFGLALVFLAKDQFLKKGPVLAVVAMDVGWVLGSALLLVFLGAAFTTLGQLLIVAVAIIVAIFATGQYIGAQSIGQR